MTTATMEDDFTTTMSGQPEAVIPFLGTHNATITLVSPKSGEHRTFRISTVRKGGLEGKRIVSLLTGSDNENDYTGFGFVREDGSINVWNKHRGTQYEKFADLLERSGYWAGRGVQYLAAGRCRRCNRLLTNDRSISLGIGPECEGKE